MSMKYTWKALLLVLGLASLPTLQGAENNAPGFEAGEANFKPGLYDDNNNIDTDAALAEILESKQAEREKKLNEILLDDYELTKKKFNVNKFKGMKKAPAPARRRMEQGELMDEGRTQRVKRESKKRSSRRFLGTRRSSAAGAAASEPAPAYGPMGYPFRSGGAASVAVPGVAVSAAGGAASVSVAARRRSLGGRRKREAAAASADAPAGGEASRFLGYGGGYGYPPMGGGYPMMGGGYPMMGGGYPMMGGGYPMMSRPSSASASAASSGGMMGGSSAAAAAAASRRSLSKSRRRKMRHQ